MVTISKQSKGVDLKLLNKGEKPEPKDFLTVNTPRLLNIATQLAQTGTYSEEEEYAEREREKAMVMCGLEFGVSSSATVSFENYDYLEKAVFRARKLHFRGTRSEDESSEEDVLVLGSDVASTTHGATQKPKIR